jgi:hypothetical protein
MTLYDDKLKELENLIQWFVGHGSPVLACALMVVWSVAQTRNPHDLERLAYLLDLFVKNLIEQKMATLGEAVTHQAPPGLYH